MYPRYRVVKEEQSLYADWHVNQNGPKTAHVASFPSSSENVANQLPRDSQHSLTHKATFEKNKKHQDLPLYVNPVKKHQYEISGQGGVNSPDPLDVDKETRISNEEKVDHHRGKRFSIDKFEENVRRAQDRSTVRWSCVQSHSKVSPGPERWDHDGFLKEESHTIPSKNKGPRSARQPNRIDNQGLAQNPFYKKKEGRTPLAARTIENPIYTARYGPSHKEDPTYW